MRYWPNPNPTPDLQEFSAILVSNSKGEKTKTKTTRTKRRCPRLENRLSGLVSSVTSRGKHLAFVRREHSSNLQEKARKMHTEDQNYF